MQLDRYIKKVYGQKKNNIYIFLKNLKLKLYIRICIG
jgi:hypothetical protein